MSEAAKKRWANMTAEDRANHGKKLKAFYERVNREWEEETARQWEEAHKEYIWNEFNRLFGD